MEPMRIGPRLSVAAVSHVGRRQNNEDFHRVLPLETPAGLLLLLAVADGMGGLEAGEWASKLAIEALSEAARGYAEHLQSGRPAVGLAPLEIPAGLIEPGEDPLEAARRELAEETGLSGDLTYLFSYFVSPGFTDEKTHVFLAENLKEVEAHPDEDEAIEVVWMRPEEALERHQRGEVEFSATGLVGVLYYHAFLRGR